MQLMAHTYVSVQDFSDSSSGSMPLVVWTSGMLVKAQGLHLGSQIWATMQQLLHCVRHSIAPVDFYRHVLPCPPLTRVQRYACIRMGKLLALSTCFQTCMQTQCSCRKHHTTAVFARKIRHQVRHAHSDVHTDPERYEHNHTIDASACRALRSWLTGLASLLLAAGQWRCWKTAENACKAEPDFMFHLWEIWHSVNFTPSDTRIAYQELVPQVDCASLCLHQQ